MWPIINDLTHLTVSPWNLILRAFVVYTAVLLLLRLSGKRQMGQTTPTEFVAILLISNAVQNAMNAGDNSLVGGLLLAVVLIFLSWGISVLTFKSRAFSVLFEGRPTLLIHKGELITKHLNHERLTHEDLKSMMRKQGVHHLSEVHTAILESDGSLSITRTSELHPSSA